MNYRNVRRLFLLSVFQRIAYTPADEINRGTQDGTLSKATEGGASNGEQNRHSQHLLSTQLVAIAWSKTSSTVNVVTKPANVHSMYYFPPSF